MVRAFFEKKTGSGVEIPIFCMRIGINDQIPHTKFERDTLKNLGATGF